MLVVPRDGMVSGHQLCRLLSTTWDAVDGVAILVPLHLIITQGIDPSSHRHVHAFIQWTRARVMRLFSVYAYDASYETWAELNAGPFSTGSS